MCRDRRYGRHGRHRRRRIGRNSEVLSVEIKQRGLRDRESRWALFAFACYAFVSLSKNLRKSQDGEREKRDEKNGETHPQLPLLGRIRKPDADSAP